MGLSVLKRGEFSKEDEINSKFLKCKLNAIESAFEIEVSK
jgi:hypothetical protein